MLLQRRGRLRAGFLEERKPELKTLKDEEKSQSHIQFFNLYGITSIVPFEQIS